MSDVSMRLTLVEDASSKMQKIASSGKNTISVMSNVGKSIDKAFQSSAPENFASETESALESLGDEAENLGAAVDSMFSSFDGGFHADFASDFSEGFREATQGASEFSESMSEVTERMGAYQDANGRWHDANGKFISVSSQMTEETDGLSDSVSGAGQAMDTASGSATSFTSALKGLFAVVSAAAIISQVSDFAKDSVELGKNFTSMMSEVQAISGATDSQLVQLETTAREYGATTVFSATEAAEALKYMSLAGWDANQSSDALGGVLNLAAASGMELGQASDMVTDYLSAFGMQASDAAYMADMLAYAQSNSNTTAEQLGEAYKNSAANLNAAGQDIETVTSLLEGMANQGYKGSEAGTALTAIMRDITNGMDEGSIKIGKTSIAVQDAEGDFRDLTDILTDVESAVDGMGSAERATALSSTFTADSTKGLNLLLNEGIGAIAGYENALRGASGAAEDMADTMNDNLAGDMANLDSAFEEMQLQIFEGMEEPLREGVQYITNEVIPVLTEWVPDAFESAVSTAGELAESAKPLFETILKNPGAVGKVFTAMASGFLAMKSVGAISSVAKSFEGVTSVGSALTKFSTALFGSTWAAGAAVVTGAIVGLGAAIDYINDKKIENNLAEHFGDITLSAEQIEDIASEVLNAEWLVNITTALGHFDNAETAREDAEKALEANNALEWKAKLGISLTEDETSTYKQNIEEFKTNIETALKEQTLAAQMTVAEFDLTMQDGTSLGSKIEEWATEDLQEMSYLSQGLTNLVENALQDGIISVDEQAAIDQLQTKISNIMSGWKEAEAQAEMDMLTQKYGRLSGADLDSGTFTSLVTELGEQRETAAEALYESEKQVYATLNSLNQVNEDGIQRISDSDLEFYKEQVAQAARNAEVAMLMNSVNFEKNTMEDAYGDLLTGNYQNIETGAQQSIDDLSELYTQYQNGTATMESLFNSMENSVFNSTAGDGRGLFGLVTDADQAALSNIYEVMKPDMESLKGVIGEYKEVGQAVPQEIMTQFNEAMMLGAAAGDMDAAWYVYASQMVESGNEEMVNAIKSGELAAPQELRNALELATSEVTAEPVTIDGLNAELEGIEYDQANVDELLAKAFEGLEATGNTATIGGELAVEYEVTEVTAGQTLSGIAEQVGATVDEILAVNPEITNPDVINVGQRINIPADMVEVDVSEVNEAVQEETAAGTEVNPIETETSAEVKVTGAEVDTSAVDEAVQEQTNAGTETTPVAVDTSADVTVEKVSDNISSFYSSVGNDIQSAFNTAFHVSARASVTVNYSIANPSATVTFSGDGTGTGTVLASIRGYAGGGYVDSPQLAWIAEGDAGEWVIPMDGSDRSKEMWSEAGQMLGVLDQPLSVTPSSGTAAAPSDNSGSAAQDSSRTVNVNINGSGRMEVASTMSKEDIVEILLENLKDALMKIVEQEILEEGDLAYEY